MYDNLPPEIIQQIASAMRTIDFIQFAEINKYTRAVCHDRVFLQGLILKRYPEVIVPPELQQDTTSLFDELPFFVPEEYSLSTELSKLKETNVFNFYIQSALSHDVKQLLALYIAQMPQGFKDSMAALEKTSHSNLVNALKDLYATLKESDTAHQLLLNNIQPTGSANNLITLINFYGHKLNKDDLLLACAKYGSTEQLKVCMRLPGINLNAIDSCGNNALFYLIGQSNEDGANLFINDERCNVMQRDIIGRSPLSNAIRKDLLAVITKLVERERAGNASDYKKIISDRRTKGKFKTATLPATYPASIVKDLQLQAKMLCNSLTKELMTKSHPMETLFKEAISHIEQLMQLLDASVTINATSDLNMQNIYTELNACQDICVKFYSQVKSFFSFFSPPQKYLISLPRLECQIKNFALHYETIYLNAFLDAVLTNKEQTDVAFFHTIKVLPYALNYFDKKTPVSYKNAKFTLQIAIDLIGKELTDESTQQLFTYIHLLHHANKNNLLSEFFNQHNDADLFTLQLIHLDKWLTFTLLKPSLEMNSHEAKKTQKIAPV